MRRPPEERGKREQGHRVPGKEPVATGTPEATPTVKATEEPAVTEAPEATEEPVATAAPEAEPAAGKSGITLVVAAAVALALALLVVVLLKSRRKGTGTAGMSTAGVVGTAVPVAKPGSRFVTEDDELRRLARRFEDLTARIQACVDDHPEKAEQTRKFFGYYVPTARRLLDYVASCEHAGVSKSELEKARATCRRSLEMACTAAQKHLDAMFSNEGMDADAEIIVMEQMLKMDGFHFEFDRRTGGKAD